MATAPFSNVSQEEIAVIAKYAGLDLTKERVGQLVGGFQVFLERTRRVDEIPAGDTVPAHVMPYVKE